MRSKTAFYSLDLPFDTNEQSRKEKRSLTASKLVKIICALSLGMAPLASAHAKTEDKLSKSAPIANKQVSSSNMTIPPEAYRDPNYVLAIVAGKKITFSDIKGLSHLLEPGLEHIPEDKRYPTLLGIYIEMLTLSTAAEQAGYAKGPEFEKQTELARANVLQKIYFQKQVLDKITDAEVKARYDKEIAILPKEEEIRARHILVKTKAEAQAIIDRLKKGEKFEEIAKKLSKDGSASVGGDLGYFSRGQMVKPFEAVAFSLKPGQFTQKPVQTPFGWHVIKVEDKRIKQPPAFDDVKDMLRNLIARDRSAAIMKDLRQKYSVTYPSPAIKNLMDNIEKQMNGENLAEEADED